MRRWRRQWQRRRHNGFYYFRKCTQNDFVYMKFSSNCKICFRPNKNCRLHRNLLELAMSVCVTANAEQSFSAVCVENLHVLLSELSMYVNLFLSISLEIMRWECGGAFILLSAPLLAYAPWIVRVNSRRTHTQSFISFHSIQIDSSTNDNILCVGYTHTLFGKCKSFT